MSRAQRPIPDEAVEILRQIPLHFVDDGCSNSPDDLFGFDFRWACRIHDWRYCSRTGHLLEMDYRKKVTADEELRENIRGSLPWRWRWAGWIYEGAVRFAGGWGSWNSCGPEAGEHCRHGMAIPESWGVEG